MMKSELDNIKGIGEKTRNELLKKLGSVNYIIKADPEEIDSLNWKEKNRNITKSFKQKLK